LVFVTLIMAPGFIGDAAETHAGTEADPWILYHTDTVKLVFDNTYNGLQIQKAEAEIAKQGVVVKTLVVEGVENFPKEAATFAFPLASEVAGLADGLYTMRARVTDYIGNVSEWCSPIYVLKQWMPPAPPGGCAILR
jgi:hypothetical protein